MAKMMKKLMAMLMALSMLVTMALPAGAEDSSGEENTPVTVTTEITDADGNVIGTMTTEIDEIKTETEDDYVSTTDVDREWSSQDTETTPGIQTESGDGTIQVESETVTEVIGSEKETDTIHTDKVTGDQVYSGTIEGGETKTVTDTTTTIIVTEGDLQNDVTTDPVVTEEKTEGQWSDAEKTEEGQWSGGIGEGDPGTFEKVPGTQKTTTDEQEMDLDKDPLDNQDVKLDLKPGKTDEEELYITIEDALANDITYKEGTQADGSQVTFIRDAKGNVVGYKIVRKVQTPGTPGEIVEGEAGAPVEQGEAVKTYIKPEGYTPGTVTSDDGTVVTVTEEIRDNAGNVIGYRITEVTTQEVPTTAEGTRDTTVPAPAVRTLPERPVASDPVTADGKTTTVTVTDIIENGEIVGYKTTTTVTDEDGNEISQESHSIYGTVTSYSETVETTPETDVITTTKTTTIYGTLTTQDFTVTTPGTQKTESTRQVTEDIYQLVQTEDGLFFLYQGEMYAVTAIGTHGDIQLESAQPDISGLEPGRYDGYVSPETLLRNPENFVISDGMKGIGPGYELEYVGYGLESSIRVDKNYKTGAGQVLVHQFKLKDRDGNYHYVLCADLDTNAVRGADYNMENVDSADYYVRDGAAAKIEAIALSGYWGTEEGVGSLDSVREFLKKHTNLTQEQIDALKPGEALTATQAAIWYFGNSDDSKAMADDAITGRVYNSDGTTRAATGPEAIRINALYQALIGLDPSKVDNNTTEFLDKDNFATDTSLVIKEKATGEDGKVKTDSKGNEKYVTDLTFSLDVEKSDLTGNLKIKVTDQYGNVLHEADLETESSNLVGKVLADGSARTTYTIKDLELAEGVNITLNLSGTQTLDEGVYLYTAEVYSTSQTFVGIGSGERDVNLSVDMKFEVTDPQARVEHTNTTWTEKKTEEETFTRTDKYQKEKKGTESTQIVVVNTKTYGTTTETDIVTRKTESRRDWRSSYEYQLMVINDEDGGGDGGEDGGGENKGKSRAEAPKTGDITLIMAAVSVASAGGLLFLNRKREED